MTRLSENYLPSKLFIKFTSVMQMGFMNIYIALHANLLTMKGDFTGDDF